MLEGNLKECLLEEIQKNGGFVNCHGHFDKAFYIDRNGLEKSMVDMEQKWRMSDSIKNSLTQNQVEQRIKKCLDIMINQGVGLTASFIDAYDVVGHKNIDAALAVKKEYENKINFLIITQPLAGLIDQHARNLYEEITNKADIAGGLPSYDRPNDEKNLDILFSIAKNLNKPIHVHIDQENNPYESDTEKLINCTLKYGYQGRVVAIHALSVSAKHGEKRREIYSRMADAGISVVVCPSAALSMKQLDHFSCPVHNSIANIPEMLEAGVTVGLGVDNISDFYQPFVDGDLWSEIRMLQESCRFYDFDELVSIASTKGKQILLQ